MAQFENPFPGMNPFLELRWPDAHVTLIGYIRDALSEELPPDLSVRAEERVTVTGTDEARDRDYQADVAVRSVVPGFFPPLWQPERSDEATVAVADPEIVLIDPVTERWLEIRDRDGRLVTAIELLSPRNKEGAGRADYLQKQNDYIAAGVNLVEIDLLRTGRHTVAVPPDGLKPLAGTHGIICVSRAQRRGRHEVYRAPLRQRLPAFRVPLRENDPDVPLDIQPLIDRCYRTGRYWQLSGPDRLPDDLPEDDRRWAFERLSAE